MCRKGSAENVNFLFCINSAPRIQIAQQVQPRMECAPAGSVHVEQPVQYVPEGHHIVIKQLPKVLRLLLAQQMLVVMYVTVFFISLALFCSLGLDFNFSFIIVCEQE